MEDENVEKKPDIVTVTLSDGVERDYVDTYKKLRWIINDRYRVQQNDHENVYIDLSYLVIALNGIEGKDFMTNFFLERRPVLEGFVQLKEEGKNSDNIENVCSEVKYRMDFSNSILCRVSFEYTRFLKKVIFNNTIILDKVDFSNSIFYDKVYFSNLIFLENLGKEDSEKLKTVNTVSVRSKRKKELVCDFTMSKFNGDVLFEEYETKEEKTNVNMLSHFKIDGSHFNKKLKIINAAIGDISMQNCHFNDTVNISLNKYDALSNIDFSFSTINCLFFIDSDLGGQKGEPIQLSKEISFSKSLITKEAFIFLRNINNGDSYPKTGTLNFEYANILGTITVQDSKLEKIKLNKSTLIGNISIENVDTGYDCRESITKVKDSFIKRNDVVNSLVYKAEEMESYSNDLSESFSYKNLKKIISESFTSILTYFKSLKFHHIIVSPFVILFKYLILPFILLPLGILLSIIPIKPVEKIREYTLLYLNRISNSFGMSWGRGVFFTCVTACAFFILINTVGIKSSPLFVWGWNGWDSFGDVWKYYLNMFYLLDFKEKFKDLLTGKSIELNALGETLFFVSKIFVSYGIYQTISAFRKYGK